MPSQRELLSIDPSTSSQTGWHHESGVETSSPSSTVVQDARLIQTALQTTCLRSSPTSFPLSKRTANPKKNRYPTQQSPKRYPISTLAMFKIAVHTSCSHYPSHELRHRQSRLGQRPTPKRTAIYNKAETMRTTMPARARRRLHSVLCSAPSFLRFNPLFFLFFLEPPSLIYPSQAYPNWRCVSIVLSVAHYTRLTPSSSTNLH